MYEIEMKRITGEKIMLYAKYKTMQAAEKAIKFLLLLDRQTGLQNVFEYEIVEIGNSAK